MITKIRSLPFIGLLTLLLVTFLLSSCGETHKTYSYDGSFTKQLSSQGMVPGKKFFAFHPGDQIALKWSASPGQDSTESSASAVKIFVELRGPYATEDAAKLAIKPGNIQGTLAASMPTIVTDDWTNKTYQYTLPLEQTLKPGFYVLSQRVVSSLASDAFNSEIQVLG